MPNRAKENPRNQTISIMVSPFEAEVIADLCRKGGYRSKSSFLYEGLSEWLQQQQSQRQQKPIAPTGS